MVEVSSGARAESMERFEKASPLRRDRFESDMSIYSNIQAVW